MPTYSYRCTACGDTFDIVQSFSDDALDTCTKCQGKLRKLFNSVGIVFKGSGFYRTDNRTESPGDSSESTKPAEPAKAPAASDSTSEKAGATSSGSSVKSTKSSESSKHAVPVS